MSEPKWTPGPWHADWDDNGQWYIAPLGVSGTALRGDTHDCIESANAHLIAAAPDLYAALASIRAHSVRQFCKRADHKPLRFPLCPDCQMDALIDVADDVLAKARGEA